MSNRHERTASKPTTTRNAALPCDYACPHCKEMVPGPDSGANFCTRCRKPFPLTDTDYQKHIDYLCDATRRLLTEKLGADAEMLDCWARCAGNDRATREFVGVRWNGRLWGASDDYTRLELWAANCHQDLNVSIVDVESPAEVEEVLARENAMLGELARHNAELYGIRIPA